MPVSKEDINQLLQLFTDATWIDETEAAEIRMYLFGLIDENKLDASILECAIDIDWQICAPSIMWKMLEEIQAE